VNESLDASPDYLDILHELEMPRALLRDAWVVYEGERWYPKLQTDRDSGKRGFEFCASGKWGRKDDADTRKEKLSLEELLNLLARGYIPSTARLRCSRDLPRLDGNARDVSKIEYSDRFKRLLALQKKKSPGR
jgi:hypothetical protein